MKTRPSLSSFARNELHTPLACEKSSKSSKSSKSPIPSPSHSSASSEAPTCWICMDDESTEVLLVNACGCKDRHVHGSCLASWVHRSQQHTCKACTLPWSPIFRPSEIISVVDFAPTEPSLPFHRHHDFACYTLSVMFGFGFIYGMVYAHFATTMERQMMTAAFANLCVVFFWNRLCASPFRRQNPRSVFEDICLLCGTYTFFLMGWITGYFILLPNIQMFLYSGIVAHAWNFFTFCFVLNLRCFCLRRGDASRNNRSEV